MLWHDAWCVVSIDQRTYFYNFLYKFAERVAKFCLTFDKNRYVKFSSGLIISTHSQKVVSGWIEFPKWEQNFEKNNNCKFLEQHGINIRTLHHYIANMHKKNIWLMCITLKMNTLNIQFGISVKIKWQLLSFKLRTNRCSNPSDL